MSGGPGRAFERVFDDNVDRVYMYFTYLLLPSGDAEHLVEVAFGRAAECWPAFDVRRATVACWLLGIARTAVGGDGVSTHDERVPQAPAPANDGSLPTSVHTFPSPSQWPTELHGALVHLAADDRELIALRLGGRLTIGEIAALVGIEQDAVKRELSAAVRRVGVQLQSAAGQPTANGPTPATPSAATRSRARPNTA